MFVVVEFQPVMICNLMCKERIRFMWVIFGEWKMWFCAFLFFRIQMEFVDSTIVVRSKSYFNQREMNFVKEWRFSVCWRSQHRIGRIWGLTFYFFIEIDGVSFCDSFRFLFEVFWHQKLKDETVWQSFWAIVQQKLIWSRET